MRFEKIGLKIFPFLTSFLCRRKLVQNTVRTLHTGKYLFSNYEGDGKTTVAFLSKEHSNILMIDTISNLGFRLNNGIFVVGPIALFPRTVLQWNVSNISDINADTLSLFCLMEPKLDILVIGTGVNSIMPSKEVVFLMKSKNIFLEVLSTDHACSTYNFLVAEKRCVAGAFIPPPVLHTDDEKMLLVYEHERLDHFIDRPRE